LSYKSGKESRQDIGRKPVRIPSSGYAHLTALLLLLLVVLVKVVVVVVVVQALRRDLDRARFAIIRALPTEGTGTEDPLKGLASTWTAGLRLPIVTENCLVAATFRMALGSIQCAKWHHFPELTDESVTITTIIHVNAPNVLPSRHERTGTTQLQKHEASKRSERR
jgi:hypothetical protein